MPTAVLDTSTILRCHRIKESIGIDTQAILKKVFGDLAITTEVLQELRNQGLVASDVYRIVKVAKLDHKIRTAMEVRGFKNLGEAECVTFFLFMVDKNSVFITDDMRALKNSIPLLGDRSKFFLAVIIDIAKYYLTKQELLQILKERHKQRKLRNKIYRALEDEINKI
ncbi:MAG: hypothetical protein ACE5J9_06370 [Methanosarcinales archaeon]